MPLPLVAPDWIAYSVGIGEDASFDLDLIRRTRCTVRAFDPTPRAARYLAALPERPPQLTYHAFGIWNRDGEVRFFAPRDPSHVSHSIHNLQGTSTSIAVPMKTLASAMREAGDARIDLLKLDVEGAEYDILDDLLATAVRPRIVCAELHDPWPRRNLALVRRLRAAGYQLVALEPPTVTLVRLGG
ncbi:FkbM family methyltransferase [Anaeromyxobacter dehalogenans]|uniref:FkbM family methyltransferase n=1 Tax=Anaeromyxobacter dehalogenans TaxID=161493 RepID=UPI00059C2675|nr:FkbM family methyltransferase [Anaeromyxobacter dehalogenans]